jgi:hypothetical protein
LVGPLKKKTPKLLNGRPEGHEIWDEYVWAQGSHKIKTNIHF